MPDDSRSSGNRWSHRAKSSWAISATVASSPARSSGMVVTATAPALSTPNQQATSHGLFGPRRSTRLPGTMPWSSVSTCATWLEMRRRSPYVQGSEPGASRQVRSGPSRSATASSSSTAQLSRSGYCSSGRSKRNSGHSDSGGRLSRQNVSTCADGDSGMATFLA